MKASKLDIVDFPIIQKSQINDEKKINTLFRAIREDVFGFMDDRLLYFAEYQMVPNYFQVNDIVTEDCHKWFLENYFTTIKDHFFEKQFNISSKGAHLNYVGYFLSNGLLIVFIHSRRLIKIYYKDTSYHFVDELVKGFERFPRKKTKAKPEISLLIKKDYGLDTSSFKLNSFKIDLKSHYNDDFEDIHQTIIQNLRKNNNKGLVLLHGKPGSGKTTYIRYLTRLLRKEIIYLPTNIATALTEPSLLRFFSEKRNAVLIIEDAESIIMDRAIDGNSSVSTLLNLADGLLSDCLNVQIICTFNIPLSQVDNALLRKGRLIAKYEFKELTVSKTNALLKQLGYEKAINEPLTLAQIYNYSNKDFASSNLRPTIGFNKSI